MLQRRLIFSLRASTILHRLSPLIRKPAGGTLSKLVPTIIMPQDIVRRNYFEERGSGRGFAGNRREDNFRGRSGNIRPGDWQCKSCGVNNFAYRTECFECGEKVRDREVAPGDWICPKCDFYNFQSRLACFKCHTPAPTFESTEPVEKT